ncbi:MAG: methyltransferase [Desulfuromonadales bacterium]
MHDSLWTPPELLKISGCYWGSCALHAGVNLGLFTPLSESPATAAELAARLELDERGLAMLLDALSAMELLEKNASVYRATPFAAEFLSANSNSYLGHIIQHHHHLVESWSRLDQVVRSGKPGRRRVSHDASERERESFLLGMFNLAMLLAPKIVKQVDLSGRKHLLDLGGGPGTYAIHFCLENPLLRATVYDLPTTRPFAEKTIARFGLQERVKFSAGDFQEDSLSGHYDVAWLSHVLHGEGSAGCRRMLQKSVTHLEPGGQLLVQEFILDDSRDRPLFPALFSLNMLLGTPHGKAYSEGELTSLMEAAGLERVQRLPIELPNGSGILCGWKNG